ncbi:gliding motility-associated C-terminal domain-containing protein [Saprospira grandis]|uniref:Uncharacterized protein n=1 Tax=Saprospira grandis (strain Lewin) TaxID=984262 RepID=H6L1D0_SAPGL|nr:gliding motility-associated C-terminal domain-containing protein [Saprospira grandis]AFC23471.1 hypothetical protein SGRA_0732 [Saprospira grandis str. Lewin]
MLSYQQMTRFFLLPLLALLLMPAAASAQGATCAASEPFCSGSGITFPAGTNQPAAPAGNNYGCLGSQPNPAWYYLQIDQPGNLIIDLVNTNSVDVDFILYGPFNNLGVALGQCGNLGNGGAGSAIESCSYSANAFETVTINNAAAGDVYILLITNFSNQPTQISANQTGGTGSTDCSILLPCAPVQFNDLTANSPYDCTGSAVTLTADPTSASPGNLGITPGFYFDIITDAFSATQNILRVYDGPNATGNIIAYWGPSNTGGNYQGQLPSNSQFQATIEYLDPATSYSMEWCDLASSGTFINEIRMSGSNTIISNTALNGGAGCTIINLGTPEGTGTFSGPGVVDNGNGTASWDPAAAGGGVHAISYNWDSGDGCVGTDMQTVIVCCDTGATLITAAPDTVCNGDSTYLSANLPGAITTPSIFSNPNSVGINSGGYVRSDITVAGVSPLTLTSGSIDSVCVDITNNPTSNINLTLVSPSGDSIDLSSGNGGINTGAYTNVCFSPTAATSVTAYSGPFTVIPPNADLSPEEPFSNLNLGASNGTWSLAVSHNALGAAGTINNWSIHFAPSSASNTYLWSGPNLSCTTCANPAAGPTVSSDYSVTLTDAVGCTYVDSIRIEVGNSLAAPTLSCGNTTANDITFDWAAVASATGYEVSLDSGLTWISPTGTLSHTVNGLPPSTSVHIYVRALGGTGICPNPIDSITCTSLSCPLILTVNNQTDASCNGFADGSVGFSVSNDIGSLSFQQTAPTLGTVQASPSFSGLAAGTYTFEVNDASLACGVSTTVTIGEPTALSTTSTGQDVSCNTGNDGEATTTPQGGTTPYSYSWDDGLNQTTATATNLIAGTYNVTITDANSCSVTDQVVISEPTAVSITMSNTDVNCFAGSDGSASAVVTGGVAPYTYLWSDLNAQNTPTANNLMAGTYTVSVTDANACLYTNSIVVNEPAAALSASLSAVDAACFGQASGSTTVTVADGTAPYTYLWNDPNAQTTATATNLAAATYTVTVTDDNGCQLIDSIVVSNGVVITSTASASMVSCQGGNDATATITPANGSAPYTYLWADGQTTQTATGLAAGPICVTVTDVNGCFHDTCIQITEPTAISATFIANSISCSYNTDGELTVNATGGTAGYSYNWSNGQTTQTATGLSAQQYYVTVTDANACVYIDSAQVSSPTPLQLSVATDSVSCRFGNDGQATATVAGGTAPYVYSWSPSNSGLAINNNLTAGTYRLTVTDLNGCTITDNALIGEPATAVQVNFLGSNDAGCFGEEDANIDADAQGGTPNYSYVWSNGELTEDLSNVGAGTYTLTATDSRGCSASNTITISQPAEIILNVQQYSNYNGAAISCPGAADGAAQVTASGGIAPYTYAWSGAQAQNGTIASNLAAGTYAVTVTDASGCTAIDSISLADPVPLDATIQQVNVFCANDCDGQIIATAVSGTGTLGVNGYEYRILGPGQTGNVFSSNNNFTGLCAGTYTVEVRDGNNCVLPISVTITEPTAIQLSLSDTDVSCAGGSDGTASVSASGGTPPYNYNWDNGMTGATITGLMAGTYEVTVTDANGCDMVSTTEVEEPAALTASMSANAPSCNGSTDGNATVSVQGGTTPYTYFWSDGQGTATAVGLSAGTHSVTITDANACQLVESIVIGEPSLLTTTISTNTAACAGANSGSATAVPTGGTAPYTYLWSDGQTTATAMNLAPGAYSVVVVDSQGCSVTEQVLLQNPDPVVLSFVSSSNPSCNGDQDGTATVVASGGTAPYTYLWPNGETTAMATSLGAGVNTVTATDANGCSTTLDVNMVEPAALVVDTIRMTAVNCKGGADGTATVFLSGGTLPYSFAWSNGMTGQSISGLAAGTYVVSVTDANGCVTNSQIIVSEPASELVATLNTADALCFGGASGQITAIVSGGTPNSNGDYTYAWSNGASTDVNSNLTVGSYSVTITDANGCFVVRSATVNESSGISSQIVNVTDASCTGSADGSAQVMASGGTGTLSYQWSDPLGQTTNVATGLSAGTYYVSVTDLNGCTQVDTAVVDEALALSITVAIDDVDCYGASTGSISITNSNEPLQASYWSNGVVGTSITAVAAGQYGVVVQSISGCVDSFSYQVAQPAELELSLNQVRAVDCYNNSTGALGSTVAGGTSPYSYLWSNGALTPSLDSIAAGNYTLNVEDANGCKVDTSISLANPTEVGIGNLNITGVACVGDANGSIQLDGTGGSTLLGGYTYSLDSLTFQGGNLFVGLEAGIYPLYVQDNNGCLFDTLVTVEAADPFFITSFGPALDSGEVEYVLEYGDTLTLFADLNDTTAASWWWTEINSGALLDSSLMMDITPYESGIYQFTAMNASGCMQDSSIVVKMEKPRNAAAPTAFTPNNDGNNDRFFIQGDEKVEQILVFRVYDRWGELVYEGVDLDPNDPLQGWDGSFKGKPMNSGAYAWYAEVLYIDGETAIINGAVNLLR